MNKRILSLLLAVVLVLGMMPTSVFATETEDTPESSEAVALCEICGAENCDQTHVFCELCQKYDCGLDHCAVCGTADCTAEHTQCVICEVWDCDEVHVYCPTCAKFDCGVDHNAEEPAETENTDPVCTCEAAEGEAHAEGCPLYVAPTEEEPAETENTDPVCTCEAAEGEAHAEGCPLYVAPTEVEPAETENTDPACTCEAAEGEAHAEDCPLYEAPELVEMTLEAQANGLTFKVEGKLPEGTQLVVETLESSVNEFIHYSVLGLNDIIDGLEAASYDITLVNNGEEIQPQEAVTVTIDGMEESDDFRAEMFHLADTSADDVYEAYSAASTPALMSVLEDLFTTTETKELVGEYVSDLTIGDGYLRFNASGFSVYYVITGTPETTDDLSNGGSHTLYMTPGATATVSLSVGGGGMGGNHNQTTNGTINSITITGYDSAVAEYSDDSTSNQSFVITADSTAESGDTTTFEVAWSVTRTSGGNQGPSGGGNSTTTQTYTATVVVNIMSEAEMAAMSFLGNTVDHVQINITCDITVPGYYEDSAHTDSVISQNFGYDEDNTTNQIQRVADDSEVGFHYELTYTANGVATTVYLRVDETATELPEGVTFDDIADTFNVTDVSEEDSQISFNGTIPVGTYEYPVVYTVTVKTTISAYKEDETTASNVDVSVSDSIGYWHSDNICPGNNNGGWEDGEITSAGGIDIGYLSTGAVLDGITYYVAFSNLNKIVSGVTLSSDNSKIFTFTIYAREKGSSGEWTAIDTLNLTAISNDTTVTLNEQTENYIDYIQDGNYEFKIVETGYTISGYSCSDVIAVKNSEGNFVTAADGVFTFTENKNTDGSIVTYSAEIRCTNTYTEAGLTISKVTEDAPASAANDAFTIKVWPNVLSTEGLEADTDMYAYFNDGAYKIGETTLEVQDGTDEAYGYISITLKGGESATIKGLPAGTYYVQEVAGTDTNWTYDTTLYTADITSGTASVTVTNVYKLGNLTITKEVAGVDESVYGDKSFTFTVVDADGTSYDVTLNSDNDWTYTLEGLLVGDATVTEAATEIDKYNLVKVEANDDDVTETMAATVAIPAGDTAEVTFTNTYERAVANLTITKKGVESKDGDAPFVFRITGEGITMNVVIYGNDSVTIQDLPAGTYTVTEISGYWRYDVTQATYSSKTADLTKGDQEVTVTNTRTNGSWLDDWASATNEFK